LISLHQKCTARHVTLLVNSFSKKMFSRISQKYIRPAHDPALLGLEWSETVWKRGGRWRGRHHVTRCGDGIKVDRKIVSGGGRRRKTGDPGAEGAEDRAARSQRRGWRTRHIAGNHSPPQHDPYNYVQCRNWMSHLTENLTPQNLMTHGHARLTLREGSITIKGMSGRS
jgi:hypothetical protein